MKSLVIYDSAYGNTEKIASSIYNTLSTISESQLILVGDVKPEDLDEIDLIVLGSPTQGGRPTEAISQFIKEIPAKMIHHTKFAVYDTRFDPKDQKKALQLLMKVIGYASPKMQVGIKKLGGTVLSHPEAFIVSGTKGPLKPGEIKRAGEWAKEISRPIVS